MSAPSSPPSTPGSTGSAPWPPRTGPDTERRIGPHPSLVIRRSLRTVTVALVGDLGPAASLGLAWVLRDLIEGQGNLAVVVDLVDVGLIDRSGVDVVASAARMMAERGGELRLATPTGPVFDTLAAAGLAGLVDDSPEQVQRSWSPHNRAASSGQAPSGARADGGGWLCSDEPGDGSSSGADPHGRRSR